MLHGFHWHCNNFTMLSKNQRKLVVISSHGSHYFMIMKLEKIIFICFTFHDKVGKLHSHICYASTWCVCACDQNMCVMWLLLSLECQHGLAQEVGLTEGCGAGHGDQEQRLQGCQVDHQCDPGWIGLHQVWVSQCCMPY